MEKGQIKRRNCRNCNFKETDPISDIICMNPDSPHYKEYVVDEEIGCNFGDWEDSRYEV